MSSQPGSRAARTPRMRSPGRQPARRAGAARPEGTGQWSRSTLHPMAVLEDTSTLTDEQLRARVVEWLRENLPPLWVEAIEDNDPEKLRRARDMVDYDEWCARLG